MPTGMMSSYGLDGLSDRTRRPFRYANQLPEQVGIAIVDMTIGNATLAIHKGSPSKSSTAGAGSNADYTSNKPKAEGSTESHHSAS